MARNGVIALVVAALLTGCAANLVDRSDAWPSVASKVVSDYQRRPVKSDRLPAAPRVNIVSGTAEDGATYRAVCLPGVCCYFMDAKLPGWCNIGNAKRLLARDLRLTTFR